MPFLLVVPKATRAPEPRAPALCPYRGAFTAERAGAALLIRSEELSSCEGRARLFPARHAGEPNQAWAKVTLPERPDAEGAAVVVERDPLGTLPLWVTETEDFVAVSPEAKAFAALPGFRHAFKPDDDVLRVERRPQDYSPFANVRRLHPRERLDVRLAGAALSIARAPDIDLCPTALFSDTGEAREALAEALLASAQALPKGPRCAAFLSGGIDSSIATSLLRRGAEGLQTFTLGTELGDEYREAAELSAALGASQTRVHLSVDQIAALWEEVVYRNEVFDGMTAEILAQVLALCQAAEGRADAVVTGYGADLLFGGMLRHKEYLQVVGAQTTEELILRTCWTMEMSPFFAWARGLRQHHLYWHPRVIETAVRVPLAMSFDEAAYGPVEKVLLRETAVERGWLARVHAFRPKLAMTSGTQAYHLVARAFGLSSPYDYAARTASAWGLLKQRLGA